MMLRTLAALAKVDGRVCAFLEPIALYMTKDLYEAGDGQWLTAYPAPDQAMALGEGRVYGAEANDLVIFTFGNGVPMSLRAAREIEAQARLEGARRRPALAGAAQRGAASRDRRANAKRILVVDEGRHSAGVGEGVITAIVEGGLRRASRSSAWSARILTRRWRARRSW